MKLIEKILSDENLNRAIKKVKSNKGAPGVDKVTVDQIDEYFLIHKGEIKNQKKISPTTGASRVYS